MARSSLPTVNNYLVLELPMIKHQSQIIKYKKNYLNPLGNTNN
ncbi:hypothetical protein M23134_07414 [Microscilla marina ATCC 23134]|uniref:Uncharacterized protein n=1 Tax=Microscilla marina ATCC 23134 TaxID=313606 RepID=A1ZEQ5_MICM2|nr:hypothetical protein M23134_07414 [Microscilla marina ATCC 23134]